MVMASGDKRANVEKVAKQLGISEYYYELTPDDKKELVDKLRRSRGPVAMVGDGINDLEALSYADLGVAVGDVDVVAEVADVVVRRVERLTDVMDGGRSYMVALGLAFVTATIIKFLAIGGGITGLLPLWLVAFLGDDGSTLAAVIASVASIAAKFRVI